MLDWKRYLAAIMLKMKVKVANYLSTKCDDQHSTFLGLPFDIWTQIFRHAGVLCQCHIRFEGVNHTCAWVHTHNTMYKKPKNLDGSVFVTCKMRKLSSHHGSKCNGDHKAFASMSKVCRKGRYIALRATLREAVCHLHLRGLNFAGFEQTLTGLNGIVPLANDLRTLHVKDGGRIDLSALHDFFEYFGNNLKGKVARFSFDCEVRDLERAERIAHMAFGNLQMLSSCNIKIDCTYASKLKLAAKQQVQDLATQIVLKSTTHGYAKGVFRFMDLPVEIHVMILRLLLVHKDMYIFRDKCSWSGKAKDPKKIEDYSCFLCSISKDSSLSSIEGQHAFRPSGGRHGQRPNTFFASSSSFSSPLDIFLVSKYMHAVASRMFFSENTFTIDIRTFLRGRRRQPLVSYKTLFSSSTESPKIRRLRLFADQTMPWTKTTIRACGGFAKFLGNEFDLNSLDLDTTSHQSGKPVNKILVEAFAAFDDFEGKRPKWYRRTNSGKLEGLH
jgi:hypothetical protein